VQRNPAPSRTEGFFTKPSKFRIQRPDLQFIGKERQGPEAILGETWKFLRQHPEADLAAVFPFPGGGAADFPLAKRKARRMCRRK
jgi:hypothetical protein